MTDLIVDANSLYARAWYATMGTGGSPVEAVRAALGTVLSLLNERNDKLGEHVDRLLFAWDGPNNRDKKRQPKPQRYYETAELLVDYFQLLFKPTQAISDTHEADDIVATACHQSTADTVYVASGDKDLQQLANDRVLYYSLNDKALLSQRAIRDKWHVKHPSQVALALAVLGDKVDGIEGIKGWGPKRVAKLFEYVTPDMNFEQAFETLLLQIPPNLHERFLSDLDLTLLNFSVPGVPQPSPIVAAPLEVAETLRLPQLMEIYRPFYHRYTSRRAVDADVDGDAEDVPQER
jgi:DNA polymerase-1